MTIADAVRELRSESGQPQQVFATRLQLAIKSLSLYESGRSRPRPKALVSLAREAIRLDRPDLANCFIRECEAATGLKGLRELIGRGDGKNGRIS